MGDEREATWIADDGTGPLFARAGETSPQTQLLVDEEVLELIDKAHAEVTRLLSEHRGQLDNLAHALLKVETLDAPSLADVHASDGAGSD